jgi:hypothetical protein
VTGSAHGLQHHPCGHVNNSLICPCAATLPTATRAQRVTGLFLAARDRNRAGAAAQPAQPLPPRGDDQ